MTGAPSAVASSRSSKSGKVVVAGSTSANCSLNDSVTDAESIVLKLQQYRSDITRQVSDITNQRAKLFEQQRRQCRECLDNERSQLPGRHLALNYAEYMRSIQLPALVQLGVTLDGGIQLDGGGKEKAGGGGATKAGSRAAATAASARGARARAAAAAAAGARAPAKMSIVDPFKFSSEDLSRLDPKEVQKLRDLFDKLACLFGGGGGGR